MRVCLRNVVLKIRKPTALIDHDFGDKKQTLEGDVVTPSKAVNLPSAIRSDYVLLY